jgi:hypothetical protein
MMEHSSRLERGKTAGGESLLLLQVLERDAAWDTG